LRTGSVFSSSSYTGVVEVAVGDVTGDGVADIAVVTNEGRPRARVYRGGDFARLVDFRPISGSGTYQGRPRVDLADVNADGLADLVVSGRYSTGTHVAGYTGSSLRYRTTPTRAFAPFVLTGSGFEEGANLAAGDLNGDGYADLVFGSGWGASRVLALSGQDLARSGTRTTLVDFTPAGSGYENGVRVGLHDLDGDGQADLLLGSGSGSGGRVTGYLGKDLSTTGPSIALDLTVYAGYTGGLYVG
ncbi:MAG TPA: VCBS repeat-containing protein, partial [Fimbriiglobus sp.]|nr:VCBS repeat-containing protein [Fimbriiglobus sp.]